MASVMRVYFEQGTDIGSAIAQITAVGVIVTHSMPPGMQPPIVIQFNASNLQVAQLTASSETLPEQQIYDYGVNFIRISLFTIPGLATPAPYGGMGRQISVDIDPNVLALRRTFADRYSYSDSEFQCDRPIGRCENWGFSI